MKATNTLHLVRAVLLEPFIEAAHQIGTPVEKMLHAAGLPTEPIVDAELLLPELPCWHFVQSVTLTEGVPNFGLIAGNAITHQDLTALVPLITGCSNLYDVLKRFCSLAPLYSNNNHYVLEEDVQAVWFTQKGLRLIADDIQVQLFEVLGMIQLVQLVAGPDWRPDEIHFTFEAQTDVEYAEEFNPSRIHYSQRHPSISIPRHLLSQPVSISGTFTDSDTNKQAGFAPIPESFSDGLRDAIIPYLGTNKLNKKLIAEITGLSPRTLHRRLAEQSTNYSQVIDNARLMKAATLLKETDAKLLDISLILGYENASSFTRAFRRWAGISPREYRYLHALS